ncbi:Boi-related e3 ubiquitin-protein ligase [Thalictrum thalictroides]|uniref:Boi-related e3 ubiquitin-protein ligase n=1 Tax=Thalictrum thalictroides TaxID=46969 RepID=A0A7J6WMU9_THATH|nr:Boi-related e3 ubiquitin-protein ligase [Thalictrum thalictroides]
MSSHQHLQLQLQHHYQQQQQQQESKPFRNLLTVDGQMSAPITFCNPVNLTDQSNPQFAPPFHVVGFAPGPIPASDGVGGCCGDLRWNNNNNGSDPKRRRLKEEDFLETNINNNNINTNSQISSLDFFQTRSVSTGLGLSLDDRRIVSSGDSPVFSILDDELDRELQRQEAEMDRFIKVQMSAPITFCNPVNLTDQSNPQFAPPFHVVGFAPGPIPASDGVGGCCGDLRWNNNNNGSDPKRRRLKEEDFLETNINNNNINTNSQISSLDFFQTRSVSTGLGLSLDDRRIVSSGDSPVFSILDDELDRELQRQEAEMDRFIKVQGEQLRQAILKKVQANQLQTLTFAEDRILQKLREKEGEIEDINRKNTELEERMKQLTVEAGAWQNRAKYNENMITALKFNLQQVFAQSRDSKEGCGDSEVDDTASCCNGGALDFQLAYKENKDLKELMACKVCNANEVCMLLLPCRHLCLCKECESKLSFCPLCQSSKFIGMEVYM